MAGWLTDWLPGADLLAVVACCLLLRLSLQQAGYRVVEAVDGQDALERIDLLAPDLVVCDLNMPRLDGLGFVRALRGCPAHRFTPVVMLTAEAGDGRQLEGRAAGVRVWITKPFDPSALVAAVARISAPAPQSHPAVVVHGPN